MTHLRQSKLHLIAVAIVLVQLIAISILAQSSALSQEPDQQPVKFILFSVTAGVPVGKASIRIMEPVFEASGIPFNTPAVFLPPKEDSFITQSIAAPADLQVNQQLIIEVLFSAGRDSIFPTEGPVHLTLAFRSAKAEATGFFQDVRLTREQVVEVSGGGLKKVTFVVNVAPPIAQSDVLTIQVGRQAKDNAQDTNPGDVCIEAVRISYGQQ